MSARPQIALRAAPQVSVVIPVFNEESCLPALFARLYPALDALHRSYECIFIDDGSTDRSVALLQQMFQRRPHETRIVILRGNFGQHAALRAGFERAQGDFIVTLDADLQNPPEEIAQLVARFDEGYDCVGTIRQQRRDIWWRRKASSAMNILRERISGIRMTDQGCMLRGYSRSVANAINQSREVSTFLPALGSLYALRSIEIPVRHEERAERYVKVFAVSADPAQLRSDDGLLARAAAVVLDGRHRHLAPVAHVRRLSRRAPCARRS